MSKRKRGAEPSSAGRRKAPDLAGQKAIARARARRSGRWAWIAVGGLVVAVIAVLIAAKSIRSQHSQATLPELSNPPATTAIGRDTLPPWSCSS
jgi:hypothetical protein